MIKLYSRAGVRTSLATIACAFFVCGPLSWRAMADRYIDFGPADNTEGIGSLIAPQPMVQVAFYTQPASGSPIYLGPMLYNSFLLDSGSSSLLTGQEATQDLQSNSAFHTGATYYEQGVAGTSPTLITDPYRFDYAGSDGVPRSLNSARALASDISLDPLFGSINGIAGTPVMVGQNSSVEFTVLPSPLPPLPYISTDVHFSAAPPAGSGHRYDVPLQMVSFPLNGRQHPTDPLPTDSPLALAPVKLSNGTHTLEGHFIVDTGAQVSIISSATAAALGIDPSTSTTFLTIGGIGGTVEMPVVSTDSFSVHTRQGIDLKWSDMEVGVVDIDPSIAGVLGWDVLSNGWPISDDTTNGDFAEFHFDFRNAANLSGELLFDVDPAHDNVTTGDNSTSWDFNGGGNYSDSTHWNSSTLPSGAGVSVTFGNGVFNTINSPLATVTIDGSYVVGSLNFMNSLGTSFVLANDGISGHGITLDNNGLGATVRVAAGVTSVQQIQANLVLADNATFDIAAGSSLSISVGGMSEIGGSRSIMLTSGGSLTFGAPNSYSGGTTINWGTLNSTVSGTLGGGPLAINAFDATASVVNLGGNETVAGLSGTLAGTGTAQLSVAASKTLTVNQSTDTSFAGNVVLSAGATAGNGGKLAKSGIGALEIDGAPSLASNSVVNVTAGTLRFNLTPTSSGAVSVGSGVTATISNTAVLELAGSVAALSAGGYRVHVVNNGSTSAGLLVSGTQQHVGAIDGTGTTQVAAGSDLTADHIIQAALVIGGTTSNRGIATIATSDQSGNPLAESNGESLAGSLAPLGQFGGSETGASDSTLGGEGFSGDPIPAGPFLDGSNNGGGPPSVPEPATLLLAVVACFVAGAMMAVRRPHRESGAAA